MPTSELIPPRHLSRKAVIYIRQSSPQQVLSNQESLRMHYALHHRAQELGWPPAAIEIIDRDLGTTAASAEHRQGFKDALAQVTLGQVGILLSFDVTRLSRNCSDWYPRLDVCGYRDCLIADRDGVYDPGSPNGRLLLGLKGPLSELALHTIRARMTAGILTKAQRGELALTLPVGFVREPHGRVVKDPNLEVHGRLRLVFDTSLQRRSASKGLRLFNAQGLTLPRRDRFGAVVWRQPPVSAILSILKHPAYAGAFTYGRTRTSRSGPGLPQARQQPLPQDEWTVCVKDKYPAYISWDIYAQIQAMLKDNYAEYDRNKTRGGPRPGNALLHGLVACGACGHKMVVQYKTGTRYLCNALRQPYGVPGCQYIPADPIDDAVVQALFAALSPVELDAYSQAMQAQTQQAETLDHAYRQQLERLQYHATLAERQFHRVAPDNRLGAAALERRWESALRELHDAQDAYAMRRATRTAVPARSEALRTAFQAVGQHLPRVGAQGHLAPAQNKALLRCLIDTVVIHRLHRDTVHTRIVWKGGEGTTLDLPMPVGSWRELRAHGELEHRVGALHRQGLPDAVIAERLTAEGYRSPMDPTKLLPSTVRGIRLQQKRFITRSQSQPRQMPGFLTVPQLAPVLDVSPYWLYDRIAKGTRQMVKDVATGLYLFPDTADMREQCPQVQDGHRPTLCFVAPTPPPVPPAAPDTVSEGLVSLSRGRPGPGRPRVLDRRIKMPDRRTHGCPHRAPN
jgi:DNA invertase Pin-like site-specific DNA recombinase